MPREYDAEYYERELDSCMEADELRDEHSDVEEIDEEAGVFSCCGRCTDCLGDYR